MLAELRIADLGVISEATLELHPGLTAVTGETGAGKTMIVTGIGLLLGGRADPKAVRSGAERARVEGRFQTADPALAEQVTAAGGDLEDHELLIARQVTSAGRSRAFVGGAQVPAGLCAGIAESLVTIHGQAEQVRLADGDRQRQLLDRFAGADVADLLASYRDRYRQQRAAAGELDRLRSDAQARAREIDLLRFGLAEIASVAPTAGEDAALAAEATRLQSVDDLQLAAQGALEAVAGGADEAGGAVAGLAAARRFLQQAATADAAVDQLATRAAEAAYLVTDLAGDLASYLAGLEVEPGRLEWIAGRRAQLAGLTRKYGATCGAVLGWASEAAAQLHRLESAEDRIEELSAEVTRLEQELTGLADQLSELRRAAAADCSARVVEELAALAMPHARLTFQLRTGPLGPHGADQVDLLFSANPGSEPRSLGRVASGGELSRVRLALEVVLAADRTAQTLIFDEVDAGVGGKVAVEIGRRLAALARHAQVVVVTHLAQVAAFADRHYVVVKSDDGQVTTSGVLRVADAERSAELARMMAGLETTESALAHAGELLAEARSASG